MKALHHAQLPNRLHNGDLQQVQGEAFSGWFPWQNGYRIASQSGRNGSHAAYCNVGNEQRGIGQTVDLNQSAPTPVVVSGWSRAHQVNGGRDSGYAIYVDVIYSDGEPLWGQNAPFDTGTHDWLLERVTIFPTKPIQRVSVYGLFRGHTGEVWFDDFAAYELGGADVTTFDGLPVESNVSVASRESGTIYQTQAGFTLGYHWEDGSVSALQVNDRELAAATVPSGFLARDVAKDSDFYGFTGGKCPPLQLKLSEEITAHDAQGNVYLTLLNDSAEPQEAVIHIQRDALNVAAVSEVMDILSATPLPVHQADDALQVTVNLAAEQTCVLWLPGNLQSSK